MWSIGYTDPFGPEGPEDVAMGDFESFRDAMGALYDLVEKHASEAEEYEVSYYEVTLADIRDIKDDPGIVDDPDQWEDQEFTFIDDICYYVVES